MKHLSFFHANEVVAFIIGVHQLSESSPQVMKYFYRLYRTCILTYGITFVIFEAICPSEKFTHFKTYITHMGILISHIVGFIKCFLVAVNFKRIKHLKDQLNQDPFKDEKINSHNYLYQESLSNGKMTVFLFVLYSFVGISAYSKSSIMLTKSNYQNITCDDFISYRFYIPVSTKTKTSCKGILMYYGFALLLNSWYILNLDCFFVSLLNCLKAQINVLCRALETIRTRTLNKLQIGKNCCELYDDDVFDMEHLMYIDLRNCLRRLDELLRFRDEIEELFTYVNLLQSMASLVTLAICLVFLASMKESSSLNIFPAVQFLLAVFCQISIFCWSGNEMIVSSNAISYSLYKSGWYRCSKRFKKSMLIMMTRMQRPVYLTLGKFQPLSLATLLTVLQGAFSYYTVLKSVE